jgi:hypothetical protein
VPEQELPLPEVPQPEQPLPELPLPEVPQPEQPLPEVPQPEQSLPEVPQPEQPLPEVPQPEQPLPEVPQPELPLSEVTEGLIPELMSAGPEVPSITDVPLLKPIVSEITELIPPEQPAPAAGTDITEASLVGSVGKKNSLSILYAMLIILFCSCLKGTFSRGFCAVLFWMNGPWDWKKQLLVSIVKISVIV